MEEFLTPFRHDSVDDTLGVGGRHWAFDDLGRGLSGEFGYLGANTAHCFGASCVDLRSGHLAHRIDLGLGSTNDLGARDGMSGALYKSLKDLMEKYEKGSKSPVKIEDMSDKTMRQINGIIGFEIEITDIQAAYKLSQNRDEKNHQTIVEELGNTNNPSSEAVAKQMSKERKK